MIFIEDILLLMDAYGWLNLVDFNSFMLLMFKWDFFMF